MNIDNKIPENNITYRERLELIIADKRGDIDLNQFSEELLTIEYATEYAKERKSFWLNWNKEYKKINKELNTQKRYIEAQQASPVYAQAVYKTLLLLICSDVISQSFESNYSFEDITEGLRELLWTYLPGSLLMMSKPLKTLQDVIEIINKNNQFLGISLEKKFKTFNDKDVKLWIKQ